MDPVWITTRCVQSCFRHAESGGKQMTTKNKASSRHKVLNHEDKGSKVLVEPENGDRFLMTMQDAVHACQFEEEKVKPYRAQLNHLIEHLRAWMQEHQDKIHRAFLTTRENQLLFLVERKQVRYDPEFEQKLIRLKLEIARDKSLSLIRLGALLIPKVSDSQRAAFLSPDVMELRHAG